MLGRILAVRASKVVCFNGVKTIYGNRLVFLQAGCIRILFVNKQSILNRLNALRYYNIQCGIDKLLLIFCQGCTTRIFAQCSTCRFSLSIRQIRIIRLNRIIAQL